MAITQGRVGWALVLALQSLSLPPSYGHQGDFFLGVAFPSTGSRAPEEGITHRYERLGLGQTFQSAREVVESLLHLEAGWERPQAGGLSWGV